MKVEFFANLIMYLYLYFVLISCIVCSVCCIVLLGTCVWCYKCIVYSFLVEQFSVVAAATP